MKNSVVIVKGTEMWPWKVDKKKPQEAVANRKPQAVTLVTRKPKEPEQSKRKLQPITQMVRNKDGQVSPAKVKRMIHDLEKMIK